MKKEFTFLMLGILVVGIICYVLPMTLQLDATGEVLQNVAPVIIIMPSILFLWRASKRNAMVLIEDQEPGEFIALRVSKSGNGGFENGRVLAPGLFGLLAGGKLRIYQDIGGEWDPMISLEGHPARIFVDAVPHTVPLRIAEYLFRINKKFNVSNYSQLHYIASKIAAYSVENNKDPGSLTKYDIDAALTKIDLRNAPQIKEDDVDKDSLPGKILADLIGGTQVHVAMYEQFQRRTAIPATLGTFVRSKEIIMAAKMFKLPGETTKFNYKFILYAIIAIVVIMVAISALSGSMGSILPGK